MRSSFDSRSRPMHSLLLGGCAAAAVAASLAIPQPARGQAFNAFPIYMTPGVSVTDSAGSSTIATDSATGIIDWATMGDTGAPFNFLPANNTATYTSGGSGNDYIILNRIFGDNPATPMQFNGTVISEISNGGLPTPGGTVWFSTPGGIIVGSGAVFDVGSLILTSQEILTLENTGDSDPDEIDFGPNGEIQFGATITDDTPSVTIQPGATINAANVGGSYVALVAPRINMGGTVNVDGSTAYIAAESLDILINNGLFDINITTGAAGGNPGEQVITHTGSTGGPSSVSLADTHAIYMVAMPKNDAVTMLVSGSVGYQPAAVAGVENGVIYLSAGDDGLFPVTTDFARSPGEGIAPPAAAQGSVSIDDATVTSRLQAFASDAIDVTSSIPGGGFALDAALFAGNSVNVSASGPGSALAFGGDLVVAANNVEQGGSAEITAENGAAISVQGDVVVDLSDTDQFADDIEQGGSATVSAIGGTITVSGNMTLDASGIGDELDAFPGDDGIGGAVLIRAAGGDIVVSGDLVARADGIGAAYSSYLYDGGNGTGGLVELYASGGSIEVYGTGGLDLDASGIGGDGGQSAGAGEGGQIFVSSEAGGAIIVANELNANVNGVGGNALSSGIAGGAGTGSFISMTATDAVISAGTIALDASAQGGDGGSGSVGGEATGGFVTVTSTTSDAIGLPPGDILADLVKIDASASGGGIDSGFSGQGGIGGDATAGGVVINADSRIGRRNSGAPAGETLDVRADALGGAGGDSLLSSAPGGRGGTALGGSVGISLVNGTLDFPDIVATADAIGGAGGDYLGISFVQDGGDGGEALAGTVDFSHGGGELLADSLALFAAGTGGAGGFSDPGNGGAGGAGTGGSVSAGFSAPDSTTALSSLVLVAGGSGGAGGGAIAIGGAGGEATGGSVDLVVADDASLQTASLVLDASASGGGSGAGADGAGAGGNASGGFVSLIGSAGNGQFTTDSAEIAANASGGQPPNGNAGAGDAHAGAINIAGNGTTVGLGDATISASGFSTDGSSIGGTISLSATGGLITSGAIGMFASGINAEGTGTGGLVTITALNDGTGSSGALAFGATSLSAHGASSVAGQSTAGNISINNIASDPARTISFASLDAQALGDNPATDPVVRIGADTGPIVVAGNANFAGTGDIVFDLVGTGFFDAGSITAAATGLIEITHLAPPAGSDALVARDMIAMSAGSGILVQGGMLVDSASSGSGVFLDGQTSVRVVTPAGRIRVLDGSGNLAGSIELSANNVAVGSAATFTALDQSASVDEREAILGANNGPVNTGGYLRASAITLTGGDSIHVQNSGADNGLPDERAGFTVGSGGLTLQTSGAGPTEIIVNGRMEAGGNVVTGRDVIDGATIQASGGGPAEFASASTINSCLILGGNCAAAPPPPPPPPPPSDSVSFDVPVRDLIEKEISDEEEESTQVRRRPVPPLIENVDLQGNAPPPMIDDPVTGTGNDDLWNENGPAGGTD